VRLDGFDLNLLVILDVLLEERNVTRASERLHIGQAATSAALARLRNYFDDRLLVQVGRRMELTPLGQSLVGPVHDVLMRARATITLRPTFEPESITRSFSVVASDYVIDVLLAQAIRRLAQTAPGMRLQINRLPANVIHVVERNAVDLLILPEQYASQLEHPQTELLSDEQVCMMCAHAAEGLTELSMAQYLDSGHVAIRLGEPDSLAYEEWFLHSYGYQRRVECTIDRFSAAPLMVMGTNRIVTIHRRVAELMASRFPVKLFSVPFQTNPLKEVMVWPLYLDEDPAHQWLRHNIEVAARGV
jgi:DNA-binding transcriptional LysR family regulator